MSGQEDERERLILLWFFKDSLSLEVDGFLDKDATEMTKIVKTASEDVCACKNADKDLKTSWS